MTEDGKGILCLGFLHAYICLQESETRLLIYNSEYFKGLADKIKVGRRKDV